MLKRFISYYRPHKRLFAMDMTASLLISVIGMVYPVVTNRMLNDYIPNRAYSAIVLAGLILLALYAVRMLLRYFVQYYGHMMGTQMQAQMRRDMFAHLEQLPFTFFDEHETGRIMSRLTSDLFEVSELAHHGPENLLTGVSMIVLSFVYLCSLNVPLTLIIFACVPVLAVVSLHLRKQMREAFTDRRRSNATINAAVESSVSGIRVTKAYTNAEKEMEKFEQGNLQFVEAARRAYRAMGRFSSSTAFITDVFNVLILIAGGLFLYNGKINFADYSTFIVSVNLFITPVTTLINFMEQYQNGVTGFQRFVEIMDIPAEEDAPGAVELRSPRGDIQLKDVSFAYEGSHGVLHHVDLQVPQGHTLALVGPSGGGKTTVCHLIPGFYKLGPEDGAILIDGQDIRSLTMDSLRRSIGIVQQDVFLFAGTIRENIRYGRLDATDAEVEAAARAVSADTVVARLEKGWDSDVGEGGDRLSTGEKQLISFARAVLADPRIFVLDEATASIDTQTEQLIQQATERLLQGRTSFLIAHRLSTIRRADLILVVRDGRILEQGTHEALLQRHGYYHALYSRQFAAEEQSRLLG